MPTKTSRLGSHIRDLEAKVPLTFDLFSGRRQPACQRGEVIFFEDLTANSGKIIMRVGNSTYVFTSSLVGSGIDHGGLAGLSDDDHPQYLLVNGTRPLTANWDAGNFAVTLGSVVGKSGDLSIAPASGGQIAFSSSIASGGTNEGFLFTDTVARTTGSHLRIDNSAGDGLFIVQPATDAFRFGLASSGTVNYSSVWLVTGTTTRNISYANALDVSSFTNAGTGAACGMRLVPKSQYATAGGASTLQVGGGDILPQYVGTSYFGIHATQNEIYGLNLILGYVQGGGANTGSNIAGWGLMVGNVGTPVGMNRWAGVLIGARPTGIAATSCVGLHSVETINVSSGTKITFDGAVTMAHSATQGSNTFTVYTEGDTYHVYNSGSTQLDLFVDAAQAFHFDAGGAAGTSRCYGALTVSGTLAASAAATVGTTLGVTGLITASVGVSATTGDITTVAGDLVSGSDIVLSSGGTLVFDGPGGNDYMQYASGLLRTTIGGAAIGDWYSGGVDVSSTKTFSIASTRLILAEAQLTHAPSSAAVFTMDMNDALLITDNSTGTARVLCDIYRNSTSGTRTVLKVRDSAPATMFECVSAGGVPQVGFYGVTPVSRSSAYTPTNVTTDRAYDANATSVDELADVLGTLIADLQALGLVA